mmetsp:Transcript_90363/g.260352  ORF Transcript_90363/g.260352 Transcript_90363/m.260352 type:complete len:108 (+) Transcript_90363:806-1129(+)
MSSGGKNVSEAAMCNGGIRRFSHARPLVVAFLGAPWCPCLALVQLVHPMHAPNQEAAPCGFKFKGRVFSEWICGLDMKGSFRILLQRCRTDLGASGQAAAFNSAMVW